MPTSKVAEFVYRLAVRTAEEKVPWQETSTDGAFRASYSENSIVISKDEFSNSFDIVVEIYNSNGQLVERVNDRDLSDIWPGGGDAFETMGKMYQRARSKALDIDKTIDTLLNEIG